MIVDTSAIMAILRGEEEEQRFTAILFDALGQVSMSAGSWVELGVVALRTMQHVPLHEIDMLLDNFGIKIVPVSLELAGIGRDGYERYGQASGTGAKLNFGDSFAYALAKATGEPLLFKGKDFAKTDIAEMV